MTLVVVEAMAATGAMVVVLRRKVPVSIPVRRRERVRKGEVGGDSGESGEAGGNGTVRGVRGVVAL